MAVKSKKGRKHGRNKTKCLRYQNQNRKELNKIRRLRRIAKGFRRMTKEVVK